MAVPSLPFSLSEVMGEFGADSSPSLRDYLRGGAYVPNTGANSGVPASGTISLSDLAGAVATAPPDTTPNSVNWANVSGATSASNANQTISGIATTISLTWNQGGLETLYSKNGGSFVAGTGVTVSNGDTLRFKVETEFEVSDSGTITVRNASDGNTVLDTFTYNLSG